MAENLRTEYGFRINAPGYITPAEAKVWFEDLRTKVSVKRGRPFGLMADIRSQKANPPETQEIIKNAMAWLRQNGMVRSAVVVDSTVARLMMVRMAKQSGVYEWERYIDASKDTDWEHKAIDWITNATEPSKEEDAAA
ncbi:hypothetical protein D7X96_19295 [Corallococcus interemptor]|uniref:STAS/SEC14 domain-containing protein n=1 Tax=Corallococcus interemptor TaxID=2316720 RepID=A0A3A8QII4_9BACT|nr:hypothetical protein [Corallococcus interemptor]RKH44370.1 hypothetical protein D7Y23_27770 [Corallococcus sp. AB050B]RKH67531.1 hypothetical protein D7X96_19295 [Corallococcus interemptor]